MDHEQAQKILIAAEQKMGKLMKAGVIFATAAIGHGIAAACKYITENGRTVLGLFAFLLAGVGLDLQTVPGWEVRGRIMGTVGITLKAWLSDSSSKATRAAEVTA